MSQNRLTMPVGPPRCLAMLSSSLFLASRTASGSGLAWFRQVVGLAKREGDDVSILLDRAGIAQVSQARASLSSRLSAFRFSCASTKTGTAISLASTFSAPGYLGYLMNLRPGISTGRLYEVHVVNDDQTKPFSLALQLLTMFAHPRGDLRHTQAASIVNLKRPFPAKPSCFDNLLRLRDAQSAAVDFEIRDGPSVESNIGHASACETGFAHLQGKELDRLARLCRSICNADPQRRFPHAGTTG